MKKELNSFYLQLHELERKYALNLDELSKYVEIKDRIKSIRYKIEFDQN